MQDGQVVLGVGQLVRRQDVGILQTQVVGFVEEAFSLDTGHVEDVEVRHRVLEGVSLLVLDVALVEDLGADMLRDLQLFRRDEDEFDVLIPGHGGDERMDGPAELEVSAAADDEVVETALFPGDGQEVGQGLGRMVMSAVARVDDRDVDVVRGHIGSALFRMAHRDDVGEALDGPRGIGHALAFGDGAVGGRGEPDDVAAQFDHGGLEAQTGAGRSLIEQRGDLLAVTLVRIDVRVLDDVPRGRDELIDLFPAQLQDIDQIFGHLIRLLRSSSRPRGCRGTCGCGRHRRAGCSSPRRPLR